jgi:hypothetical protein
MDFLWEDHLELIHSYGPKGLEMASIDWLIPENIRYISSSLESYNLFFTSLMKVIDIAMENNDYEKQDIFSEFLDTGMGEYIYTWLGKKFLPFLIFPMKIEDDNEFTSPQFSRLISNLMAFSRSAQEPPVAQAPLEVVQAPLEVAQAPLEVAQAPLEVAEAPLEVAEAPLEVAQAPLEVAQAPLEVAQAPLEVAQAPLEVAQAPLEVAPLPPPQPETPLEYFMPSNSLLWQFASIPIMARDTFKEVEAQEAKVQELKVQEAKVQEDLQTVNTVREAIRRRRITIKKNGRYSRVKTRRRHLN